MGKHEFGEDEYKIRRNWIYISPGLFSCEELHNKSLPQGFQMSSQHPYGSGLPSELWLPRLSDVSAGQTCGGVEGCEAS